MTGIGFWFCPSTLSRTDSPVTKSMTMWQPAQGRQLLSPFSHQVAGQSSMLWYDSSTVCKPLIGREHFVYQTLPSDLQHFTPEYRGEIEVHLQEDQGYIQLYGVAVDSHHAQHHASPPCPCAAADEDGGGRCEHKSPESSPRQSPQRRQPGAGGVVDNSGAAAAAGKQQTSDNRSCVIRVLRSGSYEVCMDSVEEFYTKSSTEPSSPQQPSHTHSLNPWSLKNHKRLLDKMRKSEHSHNHVRFILLKNVVADFCHPCILDLKIGSRLHGDDANSKKVASQSRKCKQTTSSLLGVRLCGMQVYQAETGVYKHYDKYHGRTLTQCSFKDMLYEFLHNGKRFRSELLQHIILRLNQLISCLKNLPSYRFYASSLLIIYDGDIHIIDEILDNQRISDAGKCDRPSTSSYLVGPKCSSEPSLPSDKNCTTQNVNLQCDKMPSLDVQTPTEIPDASSHVVTDINNEDVASCNSSQTTEVHTVLSDPSSNIDSFGSSPKNVHDSLENCYCKAQEEENRSCCDSTKDSGMEEDSQSLDFEHFLECKKAVKIDVKMIDFAHTTHRGFVNDVVQHEGPDLDYINGLSNLVTLFSQLEAESRS